MIHAAVVTACLVLLPLDAEAANGTWTKSTGGRWNEASNWSHRAVADGLDATANFSKVDITADATVVLDSPRTITSLVFGDVSPSHGWILDELEPKSQALTLAGNAPTITVKALGLGKSVAIRVPLAGTDGLMKEGPGTLTLGGEAANTLAGTVHIQEGLLDLGKPAGTNALATDNLHIGDGRRGATVKLLAANQLPDTTDVTIFNHGTLDLGGNSENINNLLDDGSGQSVVDGGSGTPILAVGSGDFAGTIKNNAGTLALNKISKGVLFLRGNNSYGGDTIISEGVLALAGASNNNIASSPLIRVETGATLNVTGLARKSGLVLAKGQTLQGTGVVRGNLTVGDGSKAAPGNGAGTLRHEGNQVWNGGGAYVFEIAAADPAAESRAGCDLLSIHGVLQVNATSQDKFTIEIVAHSHGEHPRDEAVGFDPAKDCHWVIATATAGLMLSGADSFGDRIALDTNRLTSDMPSARRPSGYFTLKQHGGDIILHYHAAGPPPEKR